MKTFLFRVYDCYDKRIWKSLLLPRILARIEDADVLARATDEQRVILTFDRDYGELIYRLRLRSPKGVIYLRFRPHTPEEPASILLNLLQIEGLQFEERFTVVDRDRIRQRPLP
ncbi:MAG: DUF5615 family PIN-like protein [Microcoleus sp. PH2017_18_LLB_O_A]|nr:MULTISPECIES: DUF5615 family PIN-like protein [unclassified Microcoleus]MCC3519922.1 DUF5615 family PIN-like protein [Microcoleus sp. PH2017_18_LLB_O_A]